MNEKQASVAARIAELSSLPITELWPVWDRYFSSRPINPTGGHAHRQEVPAQAAAQPHLPWGVVAQGQLVHPTPRRRKAAFVPFAISVAPARASEEANRWPANPRQHTTPDLECSRGQQRTEREKRRNAHRKRQIREGRAQEAKAGNRANTGVSGKKNPNR